MKKFYASKFELLIGIGTALLILVPVAFYAGQYLFYDAHRAKLSALGNPAHVTCYSGGMLIYDGTSTGKIASESGSDGYHFVDNKTGRLVEVNADCVVNYKETP